ncbi:unnamed protein product [Nezara viridula]|uniref:Uncharacterized protein n=1 Tax=Nezara viridula TaxID=85310 RepID=A0A9P0GX86_NEZVI|nr:unnamed protein product [Nezara viridula]
MSKKKFKAKVSKEMKMCYGTIAIPPKPVFKTREIPILILKKLCALMDEYTPTESNIKGGLFYGASGIGYTLVRCADYPLFEPIRERLLHKAKTYADASYEYTISHELPHISLLLGKAGIYAVDAVVYKLLGFHPKARECLHLFHAQGAHCLVPDYSTDGGEDLWNGRAGYITAALFLKKYFEEYFPTKYFYPYLEPMIKSCKEYAKKIHSTAPLAYSYYNTQCTGLLHGLGGILMIILCFPSYLDKHPGLDEEIKQTVDCILLRQKSDGKFFPLMNSDVVIPGDVVKWRSGASGLLHLMAKAYLRWKHSRYLYSCMLIGDLIWNYGLEFLLTEGRNGSGLGLDHGLVGNLYGLLILYRLTKYPIYLQQAHSCSLVLKDEKYFKDLLHRDNVYSLFNGLSGIITYLLDTINIEHAEFPCVHVFEFYEE